MSAEHSAVLKGIQEFISTIQDQTNYTDEKGIKRTGELTIGQLKVLIFIMRRGETSGSEIATALGMSKPTVSRIIALLSEDVMTRKQLPLGYVKIVEDMEDRRAKRVSLTGKGKALAGVIEEKFR
jgi:DNA-binding MarR family transcriptional regulator